jgi:hypothetical protein
MRVFRIVAMLLLVAMLSSVLVLAQDRTRGNVAGTVEDSTGAIVPNAIVTLTGPFGTQTTMTDDKGAFLFKNLTPGAVTLHAELAGFKPADAPDVSVRVDQQTFVRLCLLPSEVAHAVQVVAAAEAPIDESSKTIGATVTDTLAQDVPLVRDLSAMVFVAPGVVSGIGTGVQNPSISGATGFENLTIIDGVNVTNPDFGATGIFSPVLGPLGTGVNFDFIKEVQVQTGGFDAEYGQALGGVINVVTKGGGNEFHGGVYQYYTPDVFTAMPRQPNANLLNQLTEVFRPSIYDTSAEFGGYFIKDKLFFYVGAQPTWTINHIRAPLSSTMRLRGVINEKQRAVNNAAKLTWQLSANHQIEASYFSEPSRLSPGPHRDLNREVFLNPNEADSLVRWDNRNFIGRYNGTLSPHFVLSASVGRMFNKLDETDFANEYQIFDFVPSQLGIGGATTLGGIGFTENQRMRTDQANAIATLNYNFFGRQQTDIGWNLEDSRADISQVFSGQPWTIFPTPFTRPQDVGLPVFGAQLEREIVNGQVVFVETRGPFLPNPPLTNTNTRYNAVFAQQTWSPSKYLTLKAGGRWEQQTLRGDPTNAGGVDTHYTFTGNWAPRVGFMIDPWGKNKTKLFGSYSLYFEKIPLDLAIRALSPSAEYIGLTFSAPVLTPGNYLGGGALSGGQVVPVVPGTKSQYEREFVAGIEQTVTWHNIKVGARFIRRDLERVVEDAGNTTVEDFLSANPTPQTFVITNPSFRNGYYDPMRRYWAWQFTADKTFEEVWQMMASYSYSHLSGNYEGLFRNDNFGPNPNSSSLFDFLPSPAIAGQESRGPLPTDQKHVANLYLAHAFPEYGWNFGIGARLASGKPITALAAHPVYLDPGEIPVDGRGTFGRTAVITSIDGHVDYRWDLSDRFRLRPQIDVFNILNQQHIENVVNWIELAPGVPDVDFGKPLGMATARSPRGYQLPLSVRASLRFEF